MSGRDTEKPEDRIKRIVKEAATSSSNVTDFFAAAQKRGKNIGRPPTPPVMQITGNNNTGIVGNNNRVEINIKASPGRMPKVNLQPGPEHISDTQAAEIQELVAKVVSVTGREYPFVWSTLKRKYRFSKYQLMDKHKFEDVRAYLRQWIASGKSSTANGTAATGRKRALARIHAEAKKQNGMIDNVRSFIHGRYGTSSLSELTPGQLNEVIRQFKF